MVKSRVLFLTSALTASSVIADALHTSQAGHLPSVATITIIENAARSPAAGDSTESCVGFALKKSDVLSEARVRSDDRTTENFGLAYLFPNVALPDYPA